MCFCTQIFRLLRRSFLTHAPALIFRTCYSGLVLLFYHHELSLRAVVANQNLLLLKVFSNSTIYHGHCSANEHICSSHVPFRITEFSHLLQNILTFCKVLALHKLFMAYSMCAARSCSLRKPLVSIGLLKATLSVLHILARIALYSQLP